MRFEHLHDDAMSPPCAESACWCAAKELQLDDELARADDSRNCDR